MKIVIPETSASTSNAFIYRPIYICLHSRRDARTDTGFEGGVQS